jgi:hypothetical protein
MPGFPAEITGGIRRCIVNLLTGLRPKTRYVRVLNLSFPALQHLSARHAFPGIEGLGAKRPLLFCVGM